MEKQYTKQEKVFGIKLHHNTYKCTIKDIEFLRL